MNICLDCELNCGEPEMKSCFCHFEEGLSRNQLFKLHANVENFRSGTQIVAQICAFILLIVIESKIN